MTEQSIIGALKLFSPYLSQAGLFSSILRECGWFLVKVLVLLSDSVEAMLDQFYGLLGFFNSPEVVDFIAGFRPVLYILFAISLGVLGMQFILKGKAGRSRIVTNLVVAVMILTALPNIMLALGDFTLAGISFVKPENTSTASEILIDNITDIRLISAYNTSEVEFGQDVLDSLEETPNRLTAESVGRINITEAVYPDNIGVSAHRDLYTNKLSVGDNGEEILEGIKSPLLGIDLLNSYYYRYQVDFLTIFISLIAIVIAMFFTCYKVIRLLYEIAIHGFLAALSSVTDLHFGERTKMVLKSLGSSFAVFFLTAVFLKFYLMASNYFSANLSGLPKAFALLFAAICVVDGPNIVERILGIDAGLSSGIRSMAAMMHAAGTAGRAAGKAGRVAANMAGSAASFAGAAGGFAAGWHSTNHSSSDRQSERSDSAERADGNNSFESGSQRGRDSEPNMRQDSSPSPNGSLENQPGSPDDTQNANSPYGRPDTDSGGIQNSREVGGSDIDAGDKPRRHDNMVDNNLSRAMDNMPSSFDQLAKQSERQQRKAYGGYGVIRQNIDKTVDRTRGGYNSGKRFGEWRNKRKDGKNGK